MTLFQLSLIIAVALVAPHTHPKFSAVLAGVFVTIGTVSLALEFLQ